VVERPSFFPDVPAHELSARPERQTIMVKAPDMKAPRQFISSLHYEKELTSTLFGSIGYTGERGSRMPRLRDINTPRGPGASRPLPGVGQLLQFDSTGRSRRDELQLALRVSLNTGSRIFTNYTLASTKADGDTLIGRDRAGLVPANSNDLAAEFGPADVDSRHRLVVSGALWLPALWVLAPSFTAASGRPFNITTGLDNNGDTHFTDRPAFAGAGDLDAVDSAFGRLDYTPEPGDRIIPRNFGRRAPTYTFDLSLSKVFILGLDPAAGRTLTVNINFENVLNMTRTQYYNGVVLSPAFGQAITAEPGRRAALGLNVTF
jgi:hypothetical protein